MLELFRKITTITFTVPVLVSTVFFGLVPVTFAAKPVCVLSLGSTSTSTVAGQIRYTLTVKNVGQRQCDSARLSMYYDKGETYIQSSPLSTNGTKYYWYLGVLKSGQVIPVSITTKYSFDGITEISSSACLSSTSVNDSCTDMTTSISSSSPVVPISIPPAPVSVPVTPASPSKDYGIWVWDSPYKMGVTLSKQVVDKVSANGFNSIYITVDDYLDVNALPNGNQKTQTLKAYNDAITQFITYANQKGIAVDAESGWRDWAKIDLRYKPFAVMDYVIGYNNTHTIKFRNIQYDIEPYLLPEYETSKATVLTDYVDLVNQLVIRNTGQAGITMVIPHFYDVSQNWTPQIVYNGVTAATFTHLLKILDSKPNNSINIMAYRNYASGAGGTIELSKPEVDEASLPGHRVKINIAQETGNIDPSYVTFYGKTKTELLNQVSVINKTYASSSAFGGISVDYLDPFLQLPQ
jgi:hypothetical protein